MINTNRKSDVRLFAQGFKKKAPRAIPRKGTERERGYAAEIGLVQRSMSPEEARVLEPSLTPSFRHAVHWPEAASVSNPGAVAKAWISGD